MVLRWCCSIKEKSDACKWMPQKTSCPSCTRWCCDATSTACFSDLRTSFNILKYGDLPYSFVVAWCADLSWIENLKQDAWHGLVIVVWILWIFMFFRKKYHDSNWILNIIYLFNVISCHLSLNIFEQLFTWAADLVSRMRALTMSCVWPQLTGLGASLAECLPTWRQVPWQVRWLGFLLYRKLYTVSHDDLRLGRVFLFELRHCVSQQVN